MEGEAVDTQLLEQLREFDTPTICNALELVVPDRRGFGYCENGGDKLVHGSGGI